jgi:Carboxypeptidase regulatory-like domain
MNRRLFSLFLVGIAVLFSAYANAQTPKKNTTSLTGTVIGVNGKPVAHAAVSCESSGGIAPHAVHTDARGRFIITGLKQDNYDLRAFAQGANSEWQRNIPLKRGQTKEVTLRLVISTEPPRTMPVKQLDEKPQP